LSRRAWPEWTRLAGHLRGSSKPRTPQRKGGRKVSQKAEEHRPPRIDPSVHPRSGTQVGVGIPHATSHKRHRRRTTCSQVSAGQPRHAGHQPSRPNGKDQLRPGRKHSPLPLLHRARRRTDETSLRRSYPALRFPSPCYPPTHAMPPSESEIFRSASSYQHGQPPSLYQAAVSHGVISGSCHPTPPKRPSQLFLPVALSPLPFPKSQLRVERRAFLFPGGPQPDRRQFRLMTSMDIPLPTALQPRGGCSGDAGLRNNTPILGTAKPWRLFSPAIR